MLPCSCGGNGLDDSGYGEDNDDAAADCTDGVAGYSIIAIIMDGADKDVLIMVMTTVIEMVPVMLMTTVKCPTICYGSLTGSAEWAQLVIPGPK